MDQGMPILIVSCRPENRKLLMCVFDGLPIESCAAPNIQEAKEALRPRAFSVVFCEARLSDCIDLALIHVMRRAAQHQKVMAAHA